MFLALWLFVHFYLEDYAREKVIEQFTKSSKGLYKMEIEDVGINLLTNSFDAKGIKVYADSTQWNKQTKDTMRFSFAVELAELEVSSLRLWHFLQTDSVYIKSISIKEGDLQLYEIQDTTERKNILYELPAIIHRMTPRLTVEEFAVEGVSAEMHSMDTTQTYLYQSKFKEINTSFYQLHIDEQTTFDNAPIFYADSINLTVKKMGFQKGDVRFKVNKVDYQSNNSTLALNQIRFTIKGDTGTFPTVRFINLHVKDLIQHHVFYADVCAVQYDQLFIKSKGKGQQEQQMNNMKQKLYDNITSIVPKLHFGVLDVYGRHLRLGEMNKSSFMADSVSLAFFNLNIDTAIAPQEDKNILFSERVALSFGNIKSKSANGGSLVARKLSVSSTDSIVYLFDLSISNKGKYSLKVPETVINKFDWNAFWTTGKINVEKITLNDPDIIIRSVHKKSDSTRTVANALEEFATNLNIGVIRVKNGTFRRYIHGVTKGLEYLEAKNLYITMLNVNLHEEMVGKEASKELFSSLRHIYMKEYALKTAGQDLVLRAKSIKNRNHHKNIIVEDIYVHKENELDINIASLHIDNIDWEKYWNGEGVFHVDALKIFKPEMTLLVDKNRNKKDTVKNPSIKELLPHFVEDFSKGLEVARIELTDGKILTDISDQQMQHTFHQVNNYDLKFTGFKVYPDRPQKQFMFSEDVLLTLNNYSFRKDDLKIMVKKGRLSLKSKELAFEDLSLHNNAVHVTMPEMSISRVDLNTYWADQLLQLGDVKLFKPNVLITKQYEEEKNQGATNINGEKVVEGISDVLLSISKEIKIDHIYAEKGYFKHLVKKGKAEQVAELPVFGINLFNMRIDTTDGFDRNRFFYAEKIMLNGKNFKFLPMERSNFFLVQNIDLNSLDSSVTLHSLTFQVPSRVGINVPKVEIKQVGIEQFYKHRLLNIASVNIQRPDINIKVDKSLVRPTKVKSPSFFNLRESLPKMIGNFTKQLSISTINLSKGTLFYEGKSQGEISYNKIDDIEFEATSFSIDSSAAQNSIYETLFSKDISFQLKGFTHTTADSVFLFAMNRVQGSTSTGELEVESFVYKPYTQYDKYFNALKYRTTKADIQFTNVYGHHIDYSRLVHDQELSMTGLYFDQGIFNVFTDKRLEKDPNYSPPMPNDLMINTPFFVNIDTLKLSNTSFIYNEKEYGQSEVGAISFNDAQIKVTNLTNDPANRVPTSVTGRAKFMDDGILTLDMTIPMLSDEFRCEYSGSLGQMEAYHINRMLEPNQGIGFEKGQINYVNFEAEIKGNITQGEMEASFNDLKLRVLDDDNQGKKGLTSMMSNILIPNKSKKKRRGKIHYISYSTDGFLKILWRGVRSGLTDTVLPEFLRQKN